MEQFYDFDAMRRDVAQALEEAFAKHSIATLYFPLAVCTVLEVMASPLKFQNSATPLTHEMGRAGVDVYLASRLPRAVELLKSPHSQIVNPMMDAIAAAIHRHKGPVPDQNLLRDALRVHLKRPRLTKAGVPKALRKDASLAPAFQSAKEYLEKRGVITRTEDGQSWRLFDL